LSTFACISYSNGVSSRAENLKPLISLIQSKSAHSEEKSSPFDAGGKTSLGFRGGRNSVCMFQSKSPSTAPLKAHKLIRAQTSRILTNLLCTTTSTENTLILTWDVKTELQRKACCRPTANLSTFYKRSANVYAALVASSFNYE